MPRLFHKYVVKHCLNGRMRAFFKGAVANSFFPGLRDLVCALFFPVVMFGISPVAPHDQVRLQTLNRISQWPGFPFVLRAILGWVIGGGYGKLKPTTFRIGHMGEHTVEELEELLSVLAEVLT